MGYTQFEVYWATHFSSYLGLVLLISYPTDFELQVITIFSSTRNKKKIAKMFLDFVFFVNLPNHQINWWFTSEDNCQITCRLVVLYGIHKIWEENCQHSTIIHVFSLLPLTTHSNPSVAFYAQNCRKRYGCPQRVTSRWRPTKSFFFSVNANPPYSTAILRQSPSPAWPLLWRTLSYCSLMHLHCECLIGWM